MNIKRTWIITSVAIVLVLLLGAFGCAGPTPTATPTPTSTLTPTSTPTPTAKPTTPTATAAPKPTLTPTPSPTVKPIELKFSLFLAPTHGLNKNVFTPMAAEIEKRTNGRVKVTIYPSSVLGKAEDHYEMVARGAVDIAQAAPVYTPGRFPLTTIMELPFAYPTAAEGQKTFWGLYKKGLLDKEYAQVKVLTLGTSQPDHVFFTKAQPKTIADLKGLKIRTSGAGGVAPFDAIGVVSVPLAAGEAYQALERGVIDGARWSFAGAVSLNLQEVTRNAVEIGVSANSQGIFMNKDSFAKLPQDIQGIIEKVGEEAGPWLAKNYVEGDLPGKEVYLKAGRNVYAFPAAERSKWLQATKPLWDSWVGDMEAKGLAGKAVFSEYRTILEGLGVKLPF